MIRRITKFFSLMRLVFFAISSASFAQNIINSLGTYKIVVNGFDWGPAVDRVIVTLDTKISEIDSKSISVVETKKWYTSNPSENFNRIITNSYLSDSKGNKVKGASNSFVLELKVSPSEGSPFLYDIPKGLNDWANPYYLTISLENGQSLKSDKNSITKISIDTKYTERIMPEADKFKTGKYTADSITLNYAHFSPKKDSGKNPLVIWLHGMGEGGTDTSIALLGNKVTALVSDETQKMLNNAYVLVPQAPTFWMDNGSGDIGKFDGTSKYDNVLMSLIKDFVKNNPDIDESKIIVGGCSNGGFMTMRLLFNNPKYFSAAYPVCEPYTDKFITDEMINRIKDIPMWFTLAINDSVVEPMINELPTFQRLAKAGAKDIHISIFSNVKDTSGLYKDANGQAYEYNGHWSWIYTLNNECQENGLQLFEWAGSKVNNK